ncbi:hypothetical protein LTS14_004530 [Recurvomyces mirabilis]|nr:hypothetical protein LTS14_004530 [Recurvomyces mirabilis]
MLLAFWRGKEVPLVTVGDALSSFLQKPDPLTEGRCLMAKTDVAKGPLRWSSPTSEGRELLKPVAAYWHPVRQRWFAAVGIWRWAFTLGLITGALGGAVALLVVASNFLKLKLDTGQSVFGLGFGAVDARAVIIDSLPNAGLATEVLLANLPQVICSLLYFAYNGLFTSMVLSHEYSQYMLRNRRKALRVSSPKGEQRSKYFLHLPYTYSIPLIAISTLLHWLVSQSLFLVRVTTGSQGEDYRISSLGFSCSPILATIIVGSVLVLGAIGFGCRKLASSMPLASSCSVAISAACHPPGEDTDAALLQLSWGEVGEANTELGHCSFTSEETRSPRPRHLYAG